MGYSIIKQDDGRYALFSHSTNIVCGLDMTRAEVIDYFSERAVARAGPAARPGAAMETAQWLDEVDSDNNPSDLTLVEALRRHRPEHVVEPGWNEVVQARRELLIPHRLRKRKPAPRKSRRDRPQRREKLGSIWVDTGMLLIADPCQVLPGKDEPPRWTYDRVMELFHEQGTEHVMTPAIVEAGVEILPEWKTRERAWTVTLPNEHGPLGGLIYTTACDGYYPVFVERDAKGEPQRLVIELGGKVKP